MNMSNFMIINPKKRERISRYSDQMLFMKYVNNSVDWKNYPKRKNSILFSSVVTDFGKYKYYVIPLDKLFNMQIAATPQTDFNYTQIEDSHDYVGEYLHSCKYYNEAIDKTLLTPKALGFELFYYKDFTKVENLANYNDTNKKEFYTEMPCLLINMDYESTKTKRTGKNIYKQIKFG